MEEQKKLSLRRCKKERIAKEIEKYGCSMLKGKLSGHETKEDIVDYLLKCNCPVIKKRFLFDMPK